MRSSDRSKDTSRTAPWRPRGLIAAALATGLLVGVLGIALDALPASAAATAPSAVSFAGSPQTAGTIGATWTVGFTTSATGTLGTANKIFVTFPSSFTIPVTPSVFALDRVHRDGRDVGGSRSRRGDDHASRDRDAGPQHGGHAQHRRDHQPGRRELSQHRLLGLDER